MPADTNKGPNPSRSKGSTKKYLTATELVRLSCWLKERKDELLKSCPSYLATAARAHKDLGFTISESNLRTAAKASEVVWRQTPTSRAGDPAYRRTRERLQRAERQLAAACATIRILCARLGVEVPEAVAADPVEPDAEDETDPQE